MPKLKDQFLQEVNRRFYYIVREVCRLSCLSTDQDGLFV